MNHLWQFWKLHKTYNKCFFKLLTVINHKFHTKTKQGPISRKYYINPNYFLPFHSQNVCKTCNTICTGILQDKWIWTNIIFSWWAIVITFRPSSVVRQHFTFSSSPQKPLDQLQPNFSGMVLGWPPFKFFYELWTFVDFDRLCKLEKRGDEI
jgi:hypothetical protein